LRRRRQLLADGVPVELGARAFDLLLALLEADGSLVTKEELKGDQDSLIGRLDAGSDEDEYCAIKARTSLVQGRRKLCRAAA
jgi:hypothetical protein